MKSIIYLLLLILYGSTTVIAQSVTGPQHSPAPLSITDTSTTCYPYQLQVTTGSLYCLNNRALISTGGSSGSFIKTDGTSVTTASIPFAEGISIADGKNIVLDTTTGTKIGTATTQKIGFYNATPIVQPGATTDLGVILSNLGLRVTGTAYPISTSGLVAFSNSTDASSSGTPALLVSGGIRAAKKIYANTSINVEGNPSTSDNISITPTSAIFTNNGGNTATLAYTGGTDLALTLSGIGTVGFKAPNITDSALTSGRVTFATTNGKLTDDADLTFATDTLTATKIAATTFSGGFTMADAKNIILNTTTGTKFGTSTTQKLAFYNSTPIVKPTGNVLTALSQLGLVGSPNLTATNVGLGNLDNYRQWHSLASEWTDSQDSGSSSETDLYVSTVDKSVWTVDGQGAQFVYGGLIEGSVATTQQIKVYFDGQVIFDTGSLAVVSGHPYWKIVVDATMIPSTGYARFTTSWMFQDASYPTDVQYIEIGGLNFGSPIEIKITGTSSGSPQITVFHDNISWKPKTTDG